MEKKNTLSIVVPCYNEEEVLPTTYKVLTDILHGLNREYEVIFVNDGSKDRTWELISGFSKEDEHVGGVSLSRNRGRESAIHAGLSAARGDIVTLMDADLQDPPELLGEMLRLIEEEGYDQIGALRKNRTSQNPITAYFSESFYRTFNLLSNKTKIQINEREYRMMKRKVVDAILSYKERTRFIKGLWADVGFKVTYIAYEDKERAAGETKYNIMKLLKLGLNDVSDYADQMLLIPLWFGCISLFASVVLLFFNVSAELKMIAFGFSLSFLFIGLMCVYVRKIFVEVKNKPLYALDETITPKSLD